MTTATLIAAFVGLVIGIGIGGLAGFVLGYDCAAGLWGRGNVTNVECEKERKES